MPAHNTQQQAQKSWDPSEGNGGPASTFLTPQHQHTALNTADPPREVSDGTDGDRSLNVGPTRGAKTNRGGGGQLLPWVGAWVGRCRHKEHSALGFSAHQMHTPTLQGRYGRCTTGPTKKCVPNERGGGRGGSQAHGCDAGVSGH